MKHSFSKASGPCSAGAAIRTLLASALLGLAAHATAAPGAHGPDGEHLDDKTAVRPGSGVPRVEANTEEFELVAELRAGEFTIILDRYTTNEPVLGAKLEVETGSVKASAAFRPASGDYVVSDPAFVKALSAPGEHGLVFTVFAGQDSDLLDATLRNAAGNGKRMVEHDRDKKHALERALWGAAGLGGLGLIAGVVMWRLRQRRRTRTGVAGGLS